MFIREKLQAPSFQLLVGECTFVSGSELNKINLRKMPNTVPVLSLINKATNKILFSSIVNLGQKFGGASLKKEIEI
jgi:hypothetical protein